MPTFSNIDGEESATVTFTVAAVSLTRNSSAELQEILVLGDPEVASSLGLARVTNTAPPSTNAALNVRIASGPSSVADLSVRPIAPSTYGDGGLYRVAQSTAGDLNVTVAGYSTIAAVSSVAGRVAVAPNSTDFASSAGFHFDSSGALQITGAFNTSTTVQVSSVGGIVKVAQDAPTGSSTPWAVRLSDGSTWVPIGAEYLDGSTASSISGPTLLFDNGSNATMRAVSATMGFPVNVVGGTISASTTVQVSSVAGRVGVMPHSTDFASSAGFHFDSSGALQITGSFSASTTVQVSSLAGLVTAAPVSSSGVSMSTDAEPASTKQGLIVRQVGRITIGSTATDNVVNVSSVAGIVTARPSDTNFASSAGFHFDSSGALQITGTFSASTTVQVSSVGGVVTVAPNASSNSSVYLPVRLTNGTAFLGVGQDYTGESTLTQSSITGPAILFRASSTKPPAVSTSDMFVLPWATPNGALYGALVTDSGATVMDSTNGAVKVNVVAGSAASTTVNVSSLAGRVGVMPHSTDFGSCGGFHFDSSGALQIAGSFSASTTVNVSSVAGIVATWPVSSSGASLSTDAAPASTSYGLTVRQVGYSTIIAVSSLAGVVTAAPISSSGVSMSTDAEPASTKQGLIVRHVGRINIGSTATDNVVNVSSLAGIAAVRPSDTNWLSSAGAHFNSSGALVVDQGSTVWIVSQVSSVAGVLKSQIMDSSNVTPNIVGTRPTTGAQALAVRTVLNDLQSTCFSTMGNNSTSSTIVSSAASVKVKVYAYSITSTAQAINTLSFASSLANPIWQVQMQAISSGITGANLAVSPPAWLFATEAASPLVFKVTGTTGTYHLSFSYFTEA